MDDNLDQELSAEGVQSKFGRALLWFFAICIAAAIAFVVVINRTDTKGEPAPVNASIG